MFNRFLSVPTRFQSTLTINKPLRVFVLALVVLGFDNLSAFGQQITALPVERAAGSAQDSALAAQNRKTTQQLLLLAQGAIEVQNEVLVTGNAGKAIARRSNSVGFKELVESRAAEFADRRAALAEHQVAYTAGVTTLIPTKVEIGVGVATLWATEYTVLSLKPVPDGPAATEHVQEHRFRFANRSGDWVLVSDQLINPITPEAPAPGELPVYTTPTTRALGKGIKGQDEDGASANALASMNLNRPAIAEYATRYYKNYNSKYRAESNDCTNFVSQALYAGGWTMVTGWYKSDSVWWYNFSARFAPYHSYTWGGAHNFYMFTATRPRGTIAQYFSQMKVGDVLQVDWNNASGQSVPDGHIDHTMVVTKKSSTGELYLTYHSNNTLNKPLSDLLKLKPKAKWYGWRLYDYPN